MNKDVFDIEYYMQDKIYNSLLNSFFREKFLLSCLKYMY